MKVILGGGGDEVTSFDAHSYFYNELSINKKILYIPIAIFSKEYTPESCYQWFTSAFKHFTPVNIDLLINLADINQSVLNSYDGIFIGGGNTFRLLKELNDTGFIQLLKNYMKGSGVICGSSAGAIIFGKNIKTARFSDPNNVGLNNLEGLNLLRDYSIWCHYSDDDKPSITKLLSEGEKLIAIEENSAIYLREEKIITIGKGVHLFTSPEEKAFNLNQVVDL